MRYRPAMFPAPCWLCWGVRHAPKTAALRGARCDPYTGTSATAIRELVKMVKNHLFEAHRVCMEANPKWQH
jgi:hypothetical protein